ncbi:flagellar basal body P-ring formation chaperone FlgA [Sphingomonas sp. BAUL-RG-20F-R05-02]|uniref:flagellar basal body P-ring formation chaperone FlgA n=1 Tax=Sphingomonas sp. BAUL-RG-20F-R05-02 TaxID=2914830 RepID=UPI001F598269|nr:flagellar basal body P-ring formation chaperone FlgA [Sphingomonas sp. BAUL-RG-20F-R05-02]
MSARHLLAALVLVAAPAVAQVAPTAEADVLARPVGRGEAFSQADFERGTLPAAQVRGALRASDAVGREATRALAAGSPVRLTDTLPVQLVRRGEPVSILVHSGALTITAPGRALSGGGMGDAVRVFSNATGRTLDAVVSGTGKVLFAAS